MKNEKETENLEIEVKTQTLKKIVDIQLQDGNWNYDPYMHGMANGLILALAIMEDTEPEYLDPPKEWIFTKRAKEIESIMD